MTKKLVSYVLPVFNESDNIQALYDGLIFVIDQRREFTYEIIMVNDGSTDDSLHKMSVIQQKDERVTIINLSRNFGHQMAITAGIDHSKGDATIIMDSDLQDPPSLTMDMIGKWVEGYEVVYAVRRTRQDNLFKTLSAKLFYKILRSMSEIDIPANVGDFRLLDKKVTDQLKKFGERDRFMRGLVSYVGFSQTGIIFDRDVRHAGTSKYPLKKMWNLALSGLLGFSTVPLKLISRIGMLFSLLGIGGIVYAILAKILFPSHVVPGWAFIVISILLMGSVQLMMLGVLGEYLGRVYSEVQRRPLYIVSSIFSGSNKAPEK